MDMMNRNIFMAFILFPISSLLAQKDCNLPSRGWTPLPDLGTNKFNGFSGGLYSNGKNAPQGNYLTDAMAMAMNIVPLDTTGNPSANGTIILAGVGASNPRTEFEAFTSIAAVNSKVNPRIRMLNTCIGGQGVQKMNVSNDNYWISAFKMLDSMKLSAKQVQVVWIETDNTGNKDTGFPSAPTALVGDLKVLLQTLKLKFPNLKLCYLSARAYSGWAPPSGSGVGSGLLAPRDYFNGWAIKWLIDSAAQGASGFSYKGSGVKIPLPLYGSYNWTNGNQTRKDGFSLDCNTDVGGDGLHLSALGEQKIGQNIYNNFATDTTAKLWFLKSNTTSISNPAKNIFTVFPNPVKGDFKINSTDPAIRFFQVTVTNQLGQIVMNRQNVLSSESISVQSLKDGLYFVLISANGMYEQSTILKVAE